MKKSDWVYVLTDDVFLLLFHPTYFEVLFLLFLPSDNIVA